MFKGFANVWTPLIETSRLGATPLSLSVAGEPIVVFRGLGGKIGALIDRCPHRSVKLSLGRVASDGCLECPFHGWRFDVDGANRHVPLNPDAKRELLGAKGLPTRIVGDMVWIFTAVGAVPPEPVAHPGLTATGLARTYVTRSWRCHWTRAMENMLDSPHLPFVHRKTIGKQLLRRMASTTRMDIAWADAEWGGRTSAAMDGRDGGGILEFFRPNMMTLAIPIPNRSLHIHALVVPENDERTRLTVAVSRDFLRSGLFNGMFRRSSGKIADEDQAVAESAPAGEVPPAADEVSVATDRATLQFRKYYYEQLRAPTVR